MKKLSLAILLLLPPILGRAAFISGQFRNVQPGDKIEIFIPQRYLNGQDLHFRTALDERSSFGFSVEILEPQLAFLIFNDDRLPIFLSQEDTLMVKADAFQFPLSVSLAGKAAANNRLLQEYLQQIPLDFNEFNNIRFKIGQFWTSVEMPINDRMESLYPEAFKGYLDSIRSSAILLYEKADQQSPGAISTDFAEWLNAEINYFWAYHLLVYGQVYAGRFDIQAAFFDFLYEAPIISAALGSEHYRQFIQAFIARQQNKPGKESEDFWTGAYHLAGKLLSGKSLAFFRSEVIATAFSAERYRVILPLYTDFLQTNEIPVYEGKVEGLYQKYANVLPGSKAPAFTTTDIHGNVATLDQWKGKVVYLNFWASWCGACLRKMEIFDNYAADLSQKGIEIVNVSIDDQAANWQNTVAEYHFRGSHLLSSGAKDQNIAVIYGVEAIPQYFIIGRNGTFVEKAISNQPGDIQRLLLQIASNQ